MTVKTTATATHRDRFLAIHGVRSDAAVALPGDASARRYFRLRTHNMLLMEEQPGLPDMRSFVTVSRYLIKLGLSAPRVQAVDYEAGLALLEDFGDDTFTRLFARGAAERPLYELAIDALIHLHESDQTKRPSLPLYDFGPLDDELHMFTRWYVPQCAPRIDQAAFESDFIAQWRAALQPIAACRDVVVLRDYHVDNLMVIAGRDGMAACGLLDFQDALLGSPAYDLVSLTQDARRDLAPGLEDHLIAYYLARRPGIERKAFLNHYWLLAAHRHTKLLGNFERLSKRDAKHNYLVFIPRVQRQLTHALAEAGLSDIRDFMDRQLPDWATYKPTVSHRDGAARKVSTP